MSYQSNQANSWHKIPSKLSFLVILALLVLIVSVLIKPSNKNLDNKQDLLSVPMPTNLNFAGEMVPMEIFYVREDFEKDFYILLAQDYQNILYLKRSAQFFPFIEAEISRRNLPKDLKYIAVAESALIQTSTSTANATGIWQFIPSTAKEQGLVVNDQIDERRNFEKATISALNYLQEIYGKFNNWTLTVASYNAGYGRISESLANQKVDNYYQLYLNQETARYLFRILAIKEIMENADKYGYSLSVNDYFTWPKYQVVSVNKIDDLATWAKEQNTNLRSIKELNPWLISSSVPEGNWQIKIPIE